MVRLLINAWQIQWYETLVTLKKRERWTDEAMINLHAFHLLKTKPKSERHTNKQQLNVAIMAIMSIQE